MVFQPIISKINQIKQFINKNKTNQLIFFFSYKQNFYQLILFIIDKFVQFFTLWQSMIDLH